MTRRWQVVVLAVVVAALAGACVWWMTRTLTAQAPLSPGLATAALARLALLEPVVGEPVSSMAPTPGPQRDSVELCGLGRFTRKDIEEDGAGQAAFRTLGEDALRRTVMRLQAQPDERSRALGYVLVWSSDWFAAAQSNAKRITAEGLDCTKQSCEPLPDPAADQKRHDAIARLAQLAVGTRDPWVYGLAHQLCSRRPETAEPGACQMTSVARWAQLEPDNAVPWLFVASEASARKDAAGIADALFHASQAPRNDVRFGQSVLVAQSQVPEDVAPALALGVDVNLISVDAAVVLPGYQVVTRHCASDALGDPNRRAVCNDLATMLVERSNTLLDLSIGLGMAKRLGWSAERIARIEELRDAVNGMAASVAEADANDPSPMGCEAVAVQRERLRQVALRGELGAYRRMIAASPVGTAGLAAQYRKASQPRPQPASETAAPN